MTSSSIKISEIADVKGGKRLPKGQELSSDRTNHLYIRAQDIREGKIYPAEPKYLTPEQYQKLKRYTVSAGDVCVVIVGANVGDVGIVPAALSGANLTENAVKLTRLRQGYNPKYLNYCLSAESCQAQMRQVAGGAAQPKLGIYKVLDIEIPCASPSVQKRVADILSAYDDLIENNTRRTKVLEQTAQMLYREWFVNFRFPGHEKVKMVESEMGMVPDGWSVEPIANLAEILGGGTPATGVSEYWENGEIDWWHKKLGKLVIRVIGT
jgi:type I restriction enzyme S subunit